AGRRRALTVPTNCNNSFQKLPDIRIVPAVSTLPGNIESRRCWVQARFRQGQRVSGGDRSGRWSMVPRTRGRLDHAADDIDAHGQDCDVEYERKNAMDQGDPAHVAS